MVPSTYEAGKLYNVLPSGNRAPDQTGENSGYDQTRADFDFDRGSNTAATRVNADGLIEKYRENLFTYSNDISNAAWLKGVITATGGQSGYDGSSDAWLITKDANAYRAIEHDVNNSGVYTYSVYAKANTLDKIYLRNQTLNQGAYFNLTNGTAYGVSSLFSSIDSVGEGWYKCSVTFNGSSTRLAIYIDFDIATAGSVFVQDFQVEKGLVATDVLTSGATTGKAGVLIDLPRIDYSSGAGALLLEPSRQQLFPHSEYFDTWNSDLSEVRTPNSIVSPEGVLNGYTLAANNGGSALNIYDAISVTSGADYVFSVWLKKKTTNEIQLYMYSTSAPVGFVSRAEVDFDAGTITNLDGSGATIEPYKNGWFRCSVKCTAPAAGLSNGIYNTDGGADVYAYGAQLEAGSYVSSYIPNHGESGGVTRAADLCYKMGVSDVIGQTEGTLFYDWVMNHESPNTSEDLYTLTMSDGTGNKMIGVNNYNNTLVVFIKDTTTQFYDNSYTSGADGARIKLAIGYANNDIALYINGAQIATDSSATIPTLSQVRLNTFWNGNLADFSSVKQLALFNERLTNEELATLTTL